NCRLRHRIRRAVRKTCCFSKIMFNHIKAFSLAFFYINYGYV
ncbi:MAG: IS1 family transposase, partial [Paludibacter sp.]|nr:IS1 family transposase [Paludibacter sp.]MDO9155224.1 IS1 family transposase [Paludibacter sp.]